MERLRRNITTKDVECNCGCGFNSVSPAILDVAQRLRDWFGKPIHINTGGHCACRCSVHNTNVGGSATSSHLPDPISHMARAIDFHIEGVSNDAVYDRLCKWYPECLGIGLYTWGIHIDDRMSKAFRWEG